MVLGVVDVDAPLNSLATAVWFVTPDGSLSSPGSLWGAASDIEDLRQRLGRAIPDTAVEVPTGRTPSGFFVLGWACVLSAILLRLGSGDRGRTALPGAHLGRQG